MYPWWNTFRPDATAASLSTQPWRQSTSVLGLVAIIGVPIVASGGTGDLAGPDTLTDAWRLWMRGFLDLGVMLLGAVWLGRVAVRLHIPRVTAYLGLGVLLGPSVLGSAADAFAAWFGWDPSVAWWSGGPSLHTLGELISLSSDGVHSLTFVKEFALQAIVFAIGGEFAFKRLRQYHGSIWWISLFEIGCTLICVSLAVALFAGPLTGAGWWLGLLLGTVAIATAPAATLLVIREYDADGPMTHKLLILTGLNNLAAILLFTLVAGVWLGDLGRLPWTLLGFVGSLAIGVTLGLLLCWLERRLEDDRDGLLVLLGMLVIGLGLGRVVAALEPMIIALAFGITVGNASLKEGKWFSRLRGFEHPFGVLFFVLAGASLHLNLIPAVGLVGIAYVVARLGGKYLGPMLLQRVRGPIPNIHHTLGFGLTAQAGVAIGLATLLVAQAQGTDKLFVAQQVQTVVLAAVIAFEIAGPLLVRHTLVRAGEVKAVSLVPVHPMEDSFQHVLEQLRYKLGLSPRKETNRRELLVTDIMRRNVETLPAQTTFDGILDRLHHSPFDQIPVTRANGGYLGTITHAEVRGLIFDPLLTNLVIASDLVIPDSPTANPDDTVAELLDQFEGLHGEYVYLPVVTFEEQPAPADGEKRPAPSRRVVGVVAQTDALRAVRTGACRPGESNRLRVPNR